MTVRRFCERFGIPPSTWYYWRSAQLAGRPARRWPTPALDLVEAAAAEKKADDRFAPWGHRKIYGLLRADGVAVVSPSSVKRALARQGLLLPARYHAERRALARARKGIFRMPTPRRNRVWQTDFSELETTTSGTWDISGVVDYWGKACLACSANATKTAIDAVNSIEAAIAEAERLMGRSLKEDCVDGATGEIFPLVIVTDNGSAYKSDHFARFIKSHPWLDHVRTRYRSPQTNGVIERFFGALKYEDLYRHEIPNGIELNDRCTAYQDLYNQTRPHEMLDLYPPLTRYLGPQITFDQERAFQDHLAQLAAQTEQPEPATTNGSANDGTQPISPESLQIS